MSVPHVKHRLLISGRVQGVGFRPFVYRLAVELGLSGWVRNAGNSVLIEACGSPETLELFHHALSERPPSLARVEAVREERLPDATPFAEGFAILPSTPDISHMVRPMFSPDVAPCPACLDDMHNPGNRRHNYPFTNCTQCGPRLTITASLPYDRQATSMACFPMCAACSKEYHDPADRRFHAQPNACPDCGPRLWLVTNDECEAGNGHAALTGTAEYLLAGRVVAIKGVGGFHLACDAWSEVAVNRLRTRKHRPHKALAVMVADCQTAARLAYPTEDEIRQLQDPARPIVLCRRHPDGLPEAIAPDSDEIGLMLPSSPLHVALFAELERVSGHAAKRPPALVMTSGNAESQPLCATNREALEALKDLADAWLLHNRDIIVPIDDSVLRLVPEPSSLPNMPGITATPGARMPQFIRRARGYVPASLPLGRCGPSVLAWGADLKNTVCLTSSDQAFVSRHNGDMGEARGLNFMLASARHMEHLFRIRPQAMVCDAHPDAFTSLWAEQAARDSNIPLYRLHHHRAHAYSVLAEHGITEPVLALVLDGAGFGEDGSIWGGELLLVHAARPNEDHRLGRLRPYPLPGGDAATREPWRIARALLPQGDEHPWPWMHTRAHADHAIRSLLMTGISPMTSSCGRFFDAVSALIGLAEHISYEAQAAIRLESLAAPHWDDVLETTRRVPAYQVDIQERDGLWELDTNALFVHLANKIRTGENARTLAQNTHLYLAHGLAHMAVLAAKRYGVRHVLLTGGVMHNRIMAALLPSLLHSQGITALFPRALPPGDGGISLGQAYWLHCLEHTKA